MALDTASRVKPQEPSPFDIKRIGRNLIPLIFLGLAVHLILPQITSLENSVQVLQKLALWAVGLAALAQVVSYTGSGYLLVATVRLAQGSITILKGTVITLASSSIGLVAGGIVGGGAATFRWLRKDGVNGDAAGLAGTLPALFNNVVLLLAAIFGLVHLILVHQLSRAQLIGFSLVLVVLGMIFGLSAWGMRNRPGLVLLAKRSGKRWAQIRKHSFDEENAGKRLDGLFTAWDTLVSGGWRGPAAGAGLNVGFDMLTLYLVFIAAGHPVSPGVLLTGYGLPLLLGKLAFLVPGGVGVVEGSMAAIFNGLGVPGGVTVVVVLGYRILSFWLPTLIGFPLVLVLQRQSEPTTRLSAPGNLTEGQQDRDHSG
jgi:uncharacterized membrane protein YbhN (UPF0104 family)